MEIANLDNQVRSYSLSSILLLTHHTSGRHWCCKQRDAAKQVRICSSNFKST
jgi:hypothetical protein